MNFNSSTYFIFLALILAGWRFLPWRFCRWFLVVASYIFYGAAHPWYCVLLFLSTVVDYFVAIRMEHEEDPRRRKWLLGLSLGVGLTLIGVFKYGDFGIANANWLLKLLGLGEVPLMHLILPAGISFYTFQTLSYTIDVYRRKAPATRDFCLFVLYVAYFPQLVAGPIERAGNLMGQLAVRQKVTREDVEQGFQRILWGLVKKLVFADRLMLMVTYVYDQVDTAPGSMLALAVVGFSMQLYLDFSGYTDIALGSARMMGVRLSENFDWPYLAKNPPEFWSKWHMTLSNWIRDYLFLPLGGICRSQPLRTFTNVMVAMTLMGLWHGAAWSYVSFGIVSGLILGAYHTMRFWPVRKKHGPLLGDHWWSGPVSTVLMFFTINLHMVFFRSPDVKTAFKVLGGIVSRPWTWDPTYNLYLGLVLAVFGLHVVRGGFFADRSRKFNLPPLVRALFWAAMILLVLFGSVDSNRRFIYFQF